jgi:sulfur-carrier protein adenylyltransferase/sulfurtransferase
MQPMFSKSEIERYSRHFLLPEFGIEGQKKLKASSVLVIGAGGLGAPLLNYLAAAGVGTIGIVDFDRVEESNLQRQVLFGTGDVGKLKTEAAKNRLTEINPHVEVKTFPVKLTSANALEIIRDFGIIADGTDNFPTRYLVNDACLILGKTNVYASIFRFEGQVSVFNHKGADGNSGPNYRDLFPVPPPPGSVPDCAEGGVLGVLPGIIGSIQANEVIKLITGIGDPLSGKLFLFNARTLETQVIKIQKDKGQPPVTKLMDYEFFCGLKSSGSKEQNNMKEITAEELRHWQLKKEDFQLIDVREIAEYDWANLGGELIPLGEVRKNVQRISKEKKVVVHCRSGKRSAEAIRFLESEFGFTNLYNLKGGIIAYLEFSGNEH